MGTRWQRFAQEVSRFLAVGALATLVSFFLFNLLVHGWSPREAPLNRHPEVAYVIANTVGMVISYRGTKKWAFKHRSTDHVDGGVTAFVVVNLATMMIPLVCLWTSRNLFDLDDPLSDNISANVIGLGLAMAARFWIFHQVVFATKKPVNSAAD